MKRIIYIFALLSILFSACNKNKIDDNNIMVEPCVFNISPYTDNSLVIVRISSGKRIGRWPKQSCVGNQPKQCWLWFPKDQIIIRPNEFYEDYGYVFYDGELKYYQPRYNDITGEEMYSYELLANQGHLEITEEIVVSDNFIINELDLNSCFIIEPGNYSCEITPTECIVTLPVTTITNEDVACFFIWSNYGNSFNYTSAPWDFYVNDFNGLNDLGDVEPLGILSFNENEELVADFYASQQGPIGFHFIDFLCSEGRFNLRVAQTIDDPNVLRVLNSDTIYIESGYYDIEMSELPDKITINFGNINY